MGIALLNLQRRAVRSYQQYSGLTIFVRFLDP